MKSKQNKHTKNNNKECPEPEDGTESCGMLTSVQEHMNSQQLIAYTR